MVLPRSFAWILLDLGCHVTRCRNVIVVDGVEAEATLKCCTRRKKGETLIFGLMHCLMHLVSPSLHHCRKEMS